ncbi:MAG: universal stress protein [Calditrichaeota bacterium]|nr:MAG: universal stress protein [Calditrichota bacterium]
MKPKKILVPVDFSDQSIETTRYALAWARHYNAEITLFHAIVMYEADVDEQEHLERLEEIIRRREAHTEDRFKDYNKVLDSGDVRITTVFRRNISAANAILEYLDETPFDLVIMNTHGHGGFRKWIYGSVTEKVVRLSPVPVLTMHAAPSSFTVKNILAPVDFSENNKKGLEQARALAREHGAVIHYLHVIEQQLHPSFQVIGIESIFAINPDLRKITMDKLKEFCAADGLEARYHIVEGSAAVSIADFAGENDMDLIVMATHGYTGLDHLLIGSTAERVVRMSEKPVLTVGCK